MRTGVPFARQMLAQELGEMSGETVMPPLLGTAPRSPRRYRASELVSLAVPVCVRNVRVTEIGAERRHVAPDRLSVVRAGLQRSDGEGVTQVVQTGTFGSGSPSKPEFAREPHEN